MVNIQGGSPINQQIQNTNTFQPYQQNQIQPTTSFIPNDNVQLNPMLSNDSEKNKTASSSKKIFSFINNTFNKITNLIGIGNFSNTAKMQYSLIDSNRDNNLASTEFNSVSNIIKQSFQQVDSNTNQKVSLGEYKKSVSSHIDNQLRFADQNTDGFVNFNEAAMSGVLGYKQTQLQVEGNNVEFQGQVNEQNFKQHDSDNDGLLSKTEFNNLVMDQITSNLNNTVRQPQSQIQIN